MGFYDKRFHKDFRNYFANMKQSLRDYLGVRIGKWENGSARRDWPER
jgi:hypothetical protein